MNFEQFSKKNPAIYLITGGEATAFNFAEKSAEILRLIEKAVESKISLIQIREKQLPAKLVFELALEAAKITAQCETKLIVNDRADIALAANADGVHLTSGSLPTEIIRQNFPENFIIGVSTHSLAEAESAKMLGADFVTFSPIFKTPSKAKYGEPQGLKKLLEVSNKLDPFPVIALGGIDETNFSQVLENGARGFAGIRFLNNEVNLRKFAVNLRL